ncbi:MAG: phosphoribosylglycinamide formyltransferase [Bacteroidetes bacterium]|nr:phosphoribosylglycinamide formyltransferase [Bacteroidota bacterium]
MLHIAVFASGRGSNLQAIHSAIASGHLDADLRLVLSNHTDAAALSWAAAQGIPTVHLRYDAKDGGGDILELLHDHGADFIALAGYLKLIPAHVVRAFRHRIVNIHPALLPSFGGPGMYGRHVHTAVLAAGVKVSGATVHLVDEEYDRGPIVRQECVPVEEGDTAETLAARVLEVEHRIFPEALQLFAQDRVKVADGRVFISQ